MAVDLMTPVIEPLAGHGFGATCRGVDLNTLTAEQFKVIERALYEYKVVIIKDQSDLLPQKQLELNLRFDPQAGSHGALSKEDTVKKKTIIAGKPAVVGVDDVRLVGRCTVPAGHFGSLEAMDLMIDSHENFHRHPLTPEQCEAGDTRFFTFHTDCSFYGKDRHCSRVTTFWAHTLPDGPNVNVRFDDETGQPPISVRPGRTAFVDATQMYDELSSEDRELVDHSLVEYAPNPFEWNARAKHLSNGLGIDPTEVDKLVPVEELDNVRETDVQIIPMTWPNPVTGKKALMYQATAARKLHLRRSVNEPFTVVDDVAEVWDILYRLQRPFFREENILFSPIEQGDLAVWANRQVRHCAVEFPKRYGPRLAHQCHLAGSDSQADPVRIPGLPYYKEL